VANVRVCDCEHDRSAHEGVGCKLCANSWSPDGVCRAGGFTNSHIRRTMLKRFWNLQPGDERDEIHLVAETVEAEAYGSHRPIEMAIGAAAG
jgi:hypothetical protein